MIRTKLGVANIFQVINFVSTIADKVLFTCFSHQLLLKNQSVACDRIKVKPINAHLKVYFMDKKQKQKKIKNINTIHLARDVQITKHVRIRTKYNNIASSIVRWT